MAPTTNFLFIYGTLMSGSGHPMAARLRGESHLVGAASVPGRLYDFGRYPGAVPAAREGGPRVHGQVVRLLDPGRALPWLDVYEGVGEPDGFARVIVAARLADGQNLDAWMYSYHGALACAKYLRSGRYASRKSLAMLRP